MSKHELAKLWVTLRMVRGTGDPSMTLSVARSKRIVEVARVVVYPVY